MDEESARERAKKHERDQVTVWEEFARAQEVMATWLRSRADFYGGEIGGALKDRARIAERSAQTSFDTSDRARIALGMSPRLSQASLFDLPHRGLTVAELIADDGRNLWGWVELWGGAKGLHASGPERSLWAVQTARTFDVDPEYDRPIALLISDGPERIAAWIPPKYIDKVELWSPGDRGTPEDWYPVNAVYVSKPEWVV